MKLYKKKDLIVNYQVDESWEEIDDELIETPIGLQLKSYISSTDYQKKIYINNINKEINSLKQWFDNDYARLEQKYRRLNTLNQKCDNGTSPYDNLINLYNEAEIKRHRIQELEKLIDDTNS